MAGREFDRTTNYEMAGGALLDDQVSFLRMRDSMYQVGKARRSRSASAAILSLRGMTLELWLILVYMVITGIGDLRAAKLGFQVGPVPLFLTDITLLLLLAVSFVRSPSRILYWLSEGVGAGPVGRAVWILCIAAPIYCVLAFSEYRIYAVRDLAIFGYSLFFTLTCLAIRDRRDAMKLLRYLTYSGVATAVLLLIQGLINGFRPHYLLETGLAANAGDGSFGSALLAANGDAGALGIFSLSALLAYTMLEKDPHPARDLPDRVLFRPYRDNQPVWRRGAPSGFGCNPGFRQREISDRLCTDRRVVRSCRWPRTIHTCGFARSRAAA